MGTWFLVLASCASTDDAPTSTSQAALRRGNEQLEWFSVGVPIPRRFGGMVFDRARHHLVMAMGASAPSVRNRDIWEFDAQRLGWHERTDDSAGPTARTEIGLAYDELRHRTVLFGGRDAANEPLRDLWEWDGFAWSARSATNGPSARAGLAMTYDSGRNRVVMFGGDLHGRTMTGETWEWDGERWDNRTPASGNPSARADAGMTYDPVRGRVLLFGGRLQGDAATGDTWEWDGTSWTAKTTPTAPSPRFDAPLAYDGARQRIVLFGGADLTSKSDETWEWDGAQWTRISTAIAPSPRQGVQLAYDPDRNVTVLVGGNLDSGPTDDEWHWNGAQWTRVPRDSTRPSLRQNANMIYDRTRQKHLLYGGAVFDSGEIVGLTDTWEFAASTGWVKQAPSISPSASWFSGFAFDPVRNQTVLFGGSAILPDGSLQPVAETWIWDGSWHDRTSTPCPSARNGSAMAYDARRDRMVLFGGVTGGAYSNETWEWDGTSWENRTPSTGPQARSLSTLAFDPRSQRIFLWGGIDIERTLDDLWSWDGTNWSQVEGADGVRPSPPAVATLVESAGRSSMLLVKTVVDDTFGEQLQVWEWTDRWVKLPLARAPRSLRVFSAAPGGGSASLYGGGTDDGLFDDMTFLVSRGAPCSSAADSTTGYCVDGVSCSSAECAPCETCASPGDSGRCMPVRSVDDADSCSAADSRTCDALGRCRLVLGAGASAASECESGFIADGVCCEVESCGPCRTCNAKLKEIPDNAGRCGTERAGQDAHEACGVEPVESCGLDGTCDGRGQCRRYDQSTRCGATTQTEGRVTAQVCSGTGSCAAVDASCDGDHTLLVPGSDPIDCGAFACEGAACKASCASVTDCASGFFCTEQRTCSAYTPPTNSEDSGCSCRTGRSLPSAESTLLFGMVVLALWGMRRGRIAAASSVATLSLLACQRESPSEQRSSVEALTSAETVSWAQVGLPRMRYDAMLTYDVARARTVLFGGTDGGNTYVDAFRDLWLYDGTRWVEQPRNLAGPAVRSAGGLTYDRARNKLMLFSGGLGPTATVPSDDLWEWDGTWERRLPRDGISPPARYYPGFTYDETRHRLVMFGGSSAGIFNDLWEWDGERWENRAPETGPSPRSGARLIYDPVRRVSVLFGGYNGSTYFRDTWEWDGTSWVDRTPPSGQGPGPRWLGAAAYDRARSKLVHFAGYSGVVNREIWERDSDGVWSNRTPPSGGPLARVGSAGAYDEQRQRFVVHGGLLNNQPLKDVWEWDGASWTETSPATLPGAYAGMGLAFDRKSERVLLFAGNDPDAVLLRQLWSFDGAQWQSLTPASGGPTARVLPAMASGPSSMLVFGGNDGVERDDTWEWDGSAWIERTESAVRPTARRSAGMAYDVARASWVLFGGYAQGNVELGDTWSFDGTTWSPLAAGAPAPSPRSAMALTYDEQRHVVVAFGGRQPTGILSRELWEWDGVRWTDRTQPSDGPPPASATRAMYDATSKRVLILVSPSTVFGQDSEMWSWDGNEWSTVSAESSPPVLTPYAVTYDPKRKRALFFGSDRRTGHAVEPQTWEMSGRGAPCTSDADAVTGHCVDGVACEVAACAGICESCATTEDAGRCAPVRLAVDEDTCSGARICDANATCKSALGTGASNASECASGFLVDGVCCETAACGACSTCDATQKEIVDNPGRCGTQRAGLDLRDDCAATPAATCGLEGSCDGRGACSFHARGTACAIEGASAACSGTGECVLESAICEDDGSVRAPSGAITRCNGFRCVEGACLSTCSRLEDCVVGAVCDPDGRCVPEQEASSGDAGCACRTTSVGTHSGGAAAMLGLVLAWVGARARRPRSESKRT